MGGNKNFVESSKDEKSTHVTESKKLFLKIKEFGMNNKIIFRLFLLYGNSLFFNWILKLYKYSFLPSVDNFICHTNSSKCDSRIISVDLNNKREVEIPFRIPFRKFHYTIDEFYLGNTLEPKTVMAFLRYSYWILSPSNLFECCMVLPESYHEVNSILLRTIHYISTKSVKILFGKLIPITVVSYISYFNCKAIKNFAKSDIIRKMKSGIKTSFEYIWNLFPNINVSTIHPPTMIRNLVPNTNMPLVRLSSMIWKLTPIIGMFLMYKSENEKSILGILIISFHSVLFISAGELVSNN